jgi:hypothetical protein
MTSSLTVGQRQRFALDDVGSARMLYLQIYVGIHCQPEKLPCFKAGRVRALTGKTNVWMRILQGNDNV